MFQVFVKLTKARNKKKQIKSQNKLFLHWTKPNFYKKKTATNKTLRISLIYNTPAAGIYILQNRGRKNVLCSNISIFPDNY